MNKKSKPIIYLAFIAFIFLINSSCKKYPDGPLINLMSKEKRLERYWYMEYLEIGGIDSTSYFMAENDSGYKFRDLRFLPDRDASTISYYSLTNSFKPDLSFNWSFSNNKKDLIIDIDFYDPSGYILNNRLGPFWVSEAVKFRIRKLTKDELWLETTYNGLLTKVHFIDS
ncbi:MAG: hypothetical protein IPP56_00790 [Bacteroidetes bacterium]|nr:hypothetical protein [Bacteroidota bacterium]MBK9670987.1 hypothetical protein [Bacteroidota bacterium]MBK9798309.1 hypothetical protein [Bacteroidota bacterium]MBP6413945.1 hypothetical protein [Bacteroidia bacterium]